jgi:hypothetical protein
MSETGSCRDCGARILWVATQNDKRMPLDYEPDRRFVIDAASAPGGMRARLRNTYTCHLDTCTKRSS